MILIVVLDGLRPEQMTKEHMPNLYRLIQRGVRFLRHHATRALKTYWEEAERNPPKINNKLKLTKEQENILELFR